MIVVDSPNLFVEWDEAKKMMRVEFRGFVERDEYRGALNAVLQVAAAQKGTRILWDCRRMKVLTAEDQAWIEAEWTPRLLRETKIRRTATVSPKSMVAQMTLRRVSDKAAPIIENELASRSFDSVQDAEKWLMNGA